MSKVEELVVGDEYDRGYEAGFSDAVSRDGAYDYGYETGYDAGYEAGHEAGYGYGYGYGSIDAKSSKKKPVWLLVSAIVAGVSVLTALGFKINKRR